MLDDIGYGITAQLAAVITVTSSAVLGNVSAGVATFNKGSRVTLSKVLVAGTLPQPVDSTLGMGVSVNTQSNLELVDTTLSDNFALAAVAYNKGTVLSAKSSLFEGTKPNKAGSQTGAGVGISTGASATVGNSAILGNAAFGLEVTQASATITHTLIEGTLPDAKGNNGAGVLGVDVKSLQITSSVLLSNHLAGVLAMGGPVKIDTSVIRGVKLGKFQPPAGKGVDGLGDGVLATLGVPATTVDITSTLVEDCERAGLLFASTAGSIHTSTSTKNRFGLVLQGSPGPEVATDNAFVGNTEKDRVDSGMLPTP